CGRASTSAVDPKRTSATEPTVWQGTVQPSVPSTFLIDFCSAVSAQQVWRRVMPEPITRTILERFDVPDSNYETVIMLVEMAPQVNTGLHTHPGFDAAYLLEGDLTVLERG